MSGRSWRRPGLLRSRSGSTSTSSSAARQRPFPSSNSSFDRIHSGSGRGLSSCSRSMRAVARRRPLLPIRTLDAHFRRLGSSRVPDCGSSSRRSSIRIQRLRRCRFARTRNGRNHPAAGRLPRSPGSWRYWLWYLPSSHFETSHLMRPSPQRPTSARTASSRSIRPRTESSRRRGSVVARIGSPRPRTRFGWRTSRIGPSHGSTSRRRRCVSSAVHRSHAT